MKPTLFHDIGGVLLGHYGPNDGFQLRPGVGDWLRWTHQHFNVVWLTAWKEPEIRQLLMGAWPRNSAYATLRPPVRVRIANWKGYASKEAWILAKVKGKIPEWYWIDDKIPEGLSDLPRKRCIAVNPEGEYNLLGARAFLESLLKNKIA